MANRWLKERKATLSVPSPIFLWERGGRGCLSFFSALFNFCKLMFSGQFKQHQRFGGQGQTVCVGWMQKPPAPSPVARFAGAKSRADLSQPATTDLVRSRGLGWVVQPERRMACSAPGLPEAGLVRSADKRSRITLATSSLLS